MVIPNYNDTELQWHRRLDATICTCSGFSRVLIPKTEEKDAFQLLNPTDSSIDHPSRLDEILGPDFPTLLHPIRGSYRFLITQRRAPRTATRSFHGCRGVVSWVSLLARFALLLISDQDGVSRCQQVRLIVSRLFLTRKSARNYRRPTPRVIEHIGFPSPRRPLLSLSRSSLRDKVLDIFHENASIESARLGYLACVPRSKDTFSIDCWFNPNNFIQNYCPFSPLSFFSFRFTGFRWIYWLIISLYSVFGVPLDDQRSVHSSVAKTPNLLVPIAIKSH